MKLGIDISFLDSLDEKQGVNRYAIGIIDEFVNSKKYNIQIYVNQKIFYIAKRRFKSKNASVYKLNSHNNIKKLLYFMLIFFGLFNIYFFSLHYLLINLINLKQKKLIEDNSDVLLFLNAQDICYNLKIKTIINFHDLLHKRFPYFFSKKDLILREYIYRNSSINSDVLIASSNFMKKEFIRFYDFVKHKKIIIMREGISKKNFNMKKSGFKKKRKLKFLFYPAQLWYHKNHLLLMKAFQKICLKYNDLNLILCGSKKNNYLNVINFIKNNNLQKKIYYLGNISQKKLEFYYHNCFIVILPSLYESSSLVALEAIKMRKPIICSDIEPMKELKHRFNLIFFKSKSYISLYKSIIFALKNKKKLKIYTKYNYYNLNNFFWSKNILVLEKEIAKLIKT